MNKNLLSQSTAAATGCVAPVLLLHPSTLLRCAPEAPCPSSAEATLKTGSPLYRRCQHFLFCVAILFLLVLLEPSKISAQQVQQPDTEFVAPRKKVHPVQQKVEKEPPVRMDGILVKAVQSKRPWEIVSPFAPESYGNGEEMVSENPDELGKENGLILFGVEW